MKRVIRESAVYFLLIVLHACNKISVIFPRTGEVDRIELFGLLHTLFLFSVIFISHGYWYPEEGARREKPKAVKALEWTALLSIYLWGLIVAILKPQNSRLGMLSLVIFSIVVAFLFGIPQRLGFHVKRPTWLVKPKWLRMPEWVRRWFGV